MYYDVVCSIYEERENGCDIRVDSHLISGGFDTDDEAMKYIDNHDCSKYDKYAKSGEYLCIEIEEHNDDVSVSCVITVD